MRTQRLMGMVAGAALLLVAGVAQAQETGPSFECSEAKTLGEQLLCSDPGLAQRDLLLAQTYKARLKGPDAEAVKTAQKAWLKQRDAACGLAGQKAQDELDPAVQWRAAPCLLKQYEARLTELGARLPGVKTLPAGVWHPTCVETAVEEAVRGIDLTLCQASTTHISAAPGEFPDSFESEGLFEGFRSYNFYQKIGALPDGRPLLLTIFNGGGSGTLSLVSVVSLRKTQDGHDHLTLVPVGNGGDRCNGGISDARVSGATIRITSSLTPATLAGVLKLPDPLVDRLPDCAVCCVADLTTSQTVEGQPQAESVAIQEIDDQALGDGALDACIGKVLRSYSGRTLKMPETAALRKEMMACDKSGTR